MVSSQKTLKPITVSLFNESTCIPFTKFINVPVHPGIRVGTEWNYKTKPHLRKFQTANLSYFYHNHLTQGIGLYSEYGLEYRFKSGISTAGLLGIGYCHAFSTTEEFTFKNGNYQKKPDKGNARIMPTLSLNLGYYLKRKEISSSQLFLSYQAWAEYPYSPGFIPVMTHVNLHIGAKININKK